jgi:excisionase family DNA binding protein
VAITAPTLTEAAVRAPEVSSDSDVHPLVYSIPRTMALLGGISRSSTYELVRRGELQAVKVGGRRMIVAASLDRLIAEQLAAAGQ